MVKKRFMEVGAGYTSCSYVFRLPKMCSKLNSRLIHSSCSLCFELL